MKKIIYIVLAIIIIIAAVFFYKKSQNTENKSLTNTVSGEVYYLERIALAPGSKLIISLQDVSLMDAPAKVIGTYTITTDGQNVPIPFTINYNSKDIVANHSYSVSAKILEGDNLAWTSDTMIPVITNNNPTKDIKIRVIQVNNSSDNVEIESKDMTNDISSTKKVATENDKSSDIFSDTNYRIESVNGKTVPADSNYTVAFTDGKIQAKICNNLNGNFDLTKTTIVSQNMISTMMYCEGSMDYESSFSKLFTGDGATFSLENNILTLTNKSNNTKITLKKVN